MLDPGRKDFINSKGCIWVLSVVSQPKARPFHCHPGCFPSRPGKFLHPSNLWNDPSSEEEREAQGHSLPFVFDGDQNCKSAFDYWLLSVNDSPNYNDSKESTWPPINLQGLIFTYQHSNNTDSHSRRPY